MNPATAPATRAHEPVGGTPPDPAWRRFVLYFGAVAFVIPLFYALDTAHVWEDFYITFRFSKNLVEGNGLTYNPPQRVHGFTSPLGVLLPALFYWITGSTYAALWLFRLVSAAAFAGGGMLLLAAARRAVAASTWLLVPLGFAYLLETKSVVYSANGMETGFMLLFVAWGIHLWTRGTPSWKALGACWAGLMWTRPDGCFFIAAFAAGFLIFPSSPRRDLLPNLLRAAALCTALYLPWFVFATVYYGSPVPNTILIKSTLARAVHADALQSFPATLSRLFALFPSGAALAFEPIYARADWPEPILSVALLLALAAAFLWAVPRAHPIARRASFAFFFLALYLSIGHKYPWHAAPTALLALFAVGGSLAAAARARPAGVRLLVAAGAAVILSTQAYIFVQTWRGMKIQQAVIEDGVRTRVGLWLRENVGPGETVYLEPLGYIGYFSGATMVDYPGLVSPQLMPLLEKHGANMFAPIQDLAPTWVVFRPMEALTAANYPFFAASYQPVASFDATERIRPYAHLPGRVYREGDSFFIIYRRTDPPPSTDPGRS